jgi:hypothetical protein
MTINHRKNRIINQWASMQPQWAPFAVQPTDNLRTRFFPWTVKTYMNTNAKKTESTIFWSAPAPNSLRAWGWGSDHPNCPYSSPSVSLGTSRPLPTPPPAASTPIFMRGNCPVAAMASTNIDNCLAALHWVGEEIVCIKRNNIINKCRHPGCILNNISLFL